MKRTVVVVTTLTLYVLAVGGALVALLAVLASPPETLALARWSQVGLEVERAGIPQPGRCYRVDGHRACFVELSYDAERAGLTASVLYDTPTTDTLGVYTPSWGATWIAVLDGDLDHAARLIDVATARTSGAAVSHRLVFLNDLVAYAGWFSGIRGLSLPGDRALFRPSPVRDALQRWEEAGYTLRPIDLPDEGTCYLVDDATACFVRFGSRLEALRAAATPRPDGAEVVIDRATHLVVHHPDPRVARSIRLKHPRPGPQPTEGWSVERSKLRSPPAPRERPVRQPAEPCWQSRIEPTRGRVTTP